MPGVLTAGHFDDAVHVAQGQRHAGVFWIDLGEYDCANDTAITISNEGADGYVVVDGARWLPVEE